MPVFRYALERWPPRVFSAVIVHRGPLPAELKRAAAGLSTNFLDVVFVDRASPGLLPRDVADVAASIPESRIPWLLLLRTGDEGKTKVWAGPLNLKTIDLLSRAPERREIARRILWGDSAVWVVLKGASTTENAAALELVARAASDAEAERPQVPGPGEKSSDAPVVSPLVSTRISFSVLALPFDSEAASLLREFLAPLVPANVSRRDVLAVLFFGCGRALAVRGGESLTREQLLADCAFVVGNCSCQVKAENPGLDVYFPVRWSSGSDSSFPSGSLSIEPGIPSQAQPSGNMRNSTNVPSRASLLLKRFLAMDLMALFVLAMASIVLIRRSRS